MFKRNYSMLSFSINLTNYLVKRYNLNSSDAVTIIDDEWDYIEKEYLSGENTIEEIAKNLIDIYMVA